MNESNCKIACSLVSKTYITQGLQGLTARQKIVKALLSSRKLPERGMDEASIEGLINDLACMDSNLFLDNVGAGEREGRVACPLVARRNYRLAHGIGRSGDVAAEQPKAAGSSLLVKITNLLAADALFSAGLLDLGPVSVLPTATGMTLTLTLLALRPTRPQAQYVIWSRIDQKTCLKAVQAAGYFPCIIELVQDGDELRTDLEAIKSKIKELGPDRIAAVMTTTSCFAPRAPDRVVEVAKMCKDASIPHVINHAYGIQSRSLCELVTSAWRKGRVDAIVSSTDKNFCVPVGGAILAASKNRPELVEMVNKTYPGRASISAHLDLLMTLLHWGKAGWTKALESREQLFLTTRSKLTELAQSLGERLLVTPSNPISMALTLDRLVKEGSKDGPSFLGSMLFARCVSGMRVVDSARSKNVAVGAEEFKTGYGSHCHKYEHVYLTAAAAIGGREDEIDEICKRLRSAYLEFERKLGKGQVDNTRL